MAIHKAWYVTCDECGSPIGGNDAISIESARHARVLAKAYGGGRRPSVGGGQKDVCQHCLGNIQAERNRLDR